MSDTNWSSTTTDDSSNGPTQFAFGVNSQEPIGDFTFDTGTSSSSAVSHSTTNSNSASASAADAAPGRRGDYKAGLNEDRERRRRMKGNVELRKKERLQRLNKRRRAWGAKSSDSKQAAPAGDTDHDGIDPVPELSPQEGKTLISALTPPSGADTSDAGKMKAFWTKCDQSVHRLRAVVSHMGVPDEVIDGLVDCGVVEALIGVLRNTRDPELQLKVTWCLTNLACGQYSHTKRVVEATPYLVDLIRGSNTILQEQAAWTLGNIAGEAEEFRDRLMQAGVLLPMVGILKSTDSKVARTAAWALSNLVKGGVDEKSYVEDFFKADIVPISFSRLESMSDPHIVIEVLWMLAYMVSCGEIFAQKLVSAGLFKYVEKCVHPDAPEPIHAPTLRLVGQLASKSEEATDVLLKRVPGVLAFVRRQALCSHRGMRKEALWIFGNVTSGPIEHAKLVLDENVLPMFISCFHEATFDLRQEAGFALLHICRHDEFLRMVFEVGQGIRLVRDILQLLHVVSIESNQLALNFIDLVLHRVPDGPQLVEQCDGIAALELMQVKHDHPFLWQYASALIDSFYGDDEDGDLDGSAHNTSVEAVQRGTVDELPPWRNQNT
jgi:importin subunit alpha-6/7